MQRKRTRRSAIPLELPARMAPTDALFWYAESALPEYRPIIAGLYLLDGPPDGARLEAGIDAAIALVPRLRQRVVEAPLELGLPEWLEDAHLDRSYHVRHLSLPAPGTQRALLDLAAQLLATPLDRARPLWEAYRIDGLEGGGSAFFIKLHHALVDGVGAAAILEALTGATREARPPRVARSSRRAPAAGDAARWRRLVRDQLSATGRLARRGAETSRAVLSEPGLLLETAARTARGLRGVVADLARAPVADPLAVPGSGLARRLDVLEIPLERLRGIKRALGVTLNDLVLAALATTLRAYHREREVASDDLVCMVPMSLRGRDERDMLGNRVGMFSILLPVGEPQLERRLARVVTQTRAAKEDQRAAGMPLLVEALTWIPGAALRLLGRQALGRINVACTNVPGVREPRYLAGARIESIFPFASVVEGTPLVVALLSYAGRMEVGIDTDPEAIPDPHRIGALFADAVEELAKLSAEVASRGGRELEP